MSDGAHALVDFLAFIAKKDRDAAVRDEGGDAPRALAPVFWRAFVDLVQRDPQARTAVVRRLDTETKADAMFRLALAYSPQQLAELSDTIERLDDTLRTARVVRAIRSVVILAHHRSRYVGRIATRVLARTPQFLARLGDSRRLKELASDIRQEADIERVPSEQIELLGDAFDVASLRGALVAVLEGAPAELDAELVHEVDKYVRELFKACFRDVRLRSPMFEHYRPGANIALFATGGYGRKEAFGSDFDYLAVVDDDDRGLKKFFGKVLQRVAGAMTRRGLHPHNRLTAHFNAYVVSIPELVEYLDSRTDETFIDEAETLEARFVLGDPLVAQAFDKEVRARVMGRNANPFLQDLLRELRERRDQLPPHLNLKRGPGGLRELHLLWLALRVVAELPAPLGPEQMRAFAKALPECRTDVRFLMVVHAELRRARDLHRLTVAFDDKIVSSALISVAKDLRPIREAGVNEGFAREMRKLMAASALRIDRVASAIAKRLPQEPPP